MGASWLYRKYSSIQCLSNLFLNVLTFGAVTTGSGNSFPTLVILTGNSLCVDVTMYVGRCALLRVDSL